MNNLGDIIDVFSSTSNPNGVAIKSTALVNTLSPSAANDAIVQKLISYVSQNQAQISYTNLQNLKAAIEGYQAKSTPVTPKSSTPTAPLYPTLSQNNVADNNVNAGFNFKPVLIVTGILALAAGLFYAFKPQTHE